MIDSIVWGWGRRAQNVNSCYYHCCDQLLNPTNDEGMKERRYTEFTFKNAEKTLVFCFERLDQFSVVMGNRVLKLRLNYRKIRNAFYLFCNPECL